MARRAARFLLLAVIALGVVGMHTLGHPGSDHGPDASMVHVAAMPHEAILGMSAPLVAVAASDGVSVAGRTGPAMGSMDVCLAILTVFGIAALLLALLTGRGRGPRIVFGERVRGTILGRGPPPRVPPLARRLATLSVLRT
jgi:hypothetical protein